MHSYLVHKKTSWTEIVCSLFSEKSLSLCLQMVTKLTKTNWSIPNMLVNSLQNYTELFLLLALFGVLLGNLMTRRLRLYWRSNGLVQVDVRRLYEDVPRPESHARPARKPTQISKQNTGQCSKAKHYYIFHCPAPRCIFDNQLFNVND